MPITVLKEQVVNQIAAGEVVERPASVVKELVENALDAGASRVQVTIEGGGVDLVRVTDDGVGIETSEVELAFARHATSKLRQVEDLWSIRTLGFRGEALPSIASVAKVTLVTRAAGASLGRRVAVEGGMLGAASDCGAPGGTTVEVRDLFFNTPARRKFLKSAAAETGRIAALLSAMAAVRPDVGFTLVSEGRTMVTTAGDGNLRETLIRLLGGDAATALLPVARESPVCSVRGFVAASAFSWANRAWELFAVNGRLVESRRLQAAVEKAYGGQLPLRRYPVAVLQICIDPGQVDVNVHPAKREVRFRREGEVFQVVHGAVEEALRQQPFYRPVRWTEVSSAGRGGSAAVTAGEGFSLGLEWGRGFPVGEKEAYAGRTVAEPPVRREAEPPPGPAGAEPGVGKALRYLGQLAGTYLLGEDEEGLVLIYQHAAHERVIYDALEAAFAARSAMPAQALLLPQQAELSPAEAAVLGEVLPVLQGLGYEVEPFGGRSVLVRAVPVLLAAAGLREMLAEVAADETAVDGRGSLPGTVERLFRRLACRAAIKANQALGLSEAEALLEQWHASTQPWTCPHGRPVALRWSLGQVAASFLRR